MFDMFLCLSGFWLPNPSPLSRLVRGRGRFPIHSYTPPLWHQGISQCSRHGEIKILNVIRMYSDLGFYFVCCCLWFSLAWFDGLMVYPVGCFPWFDCRRRCKFPWEDRLSLNMANSDNHEHKESYKEWAYRAAACRDSDQTQCALHAQYPNSFLGLLGVKLSSLVSTWSR